MSTPVADTVENALATPEKEQPYGALGLKPDEQGMATLTWIAHGTHLIETGAGARILSHLIETSSRVQAPAIRSYVDRLRQANPDSAPADIVAKLEKHYMAAVMASGAAVGSAALFPGIGTLAAMSAVAGETVVFLEATTVFALAVADAWQKHGIGRKLMSALIESARIKGYRAIVGDVLSQNTKMFRLMGSLGFTIHPHPDDPAVKRVICSLHS